MATATVPVSEVPSEVKKVVLVTRMSVDEIAASRNFLEGGLSPGHFIEVLRDGIVIAEVSAPGDTTPSRIAASAPFPDFKQRLRELWGETPSSSDTTQVISADRDER